MGTPYPMEAPQRSHARKCTALTEESEKRWSGPFSFIQAADTQFGMIDFYVKKVPEPNVTWKKEMEDTRKVILAANRMRPLPRFFVVCGDLVDALPGAMHREKQEEDWNRVFMELDNRIPLICVCGNHDIGDTPTNETIERFEKVFKTDDYFSFWCGGVYNLVLNSQLFEDASRVPGRAQSQRTWIDEQLKYANANSAKKIFIFQHIPYFLKEAGEDKEYFNLENPLRRILLNKFNDAGVNAIFCGHYHRNGGGFYRNLEVIVTSAIGAALGEDKSGIRIVNVYADRIEHKYYEIDNIPREPGLKPH